MTAATDRKLVLDDISDLRAYERVRDEFRAEIIALKKRRRIHVGPHITLMFENRDTIRFQIQEMARAEKILSDEGIETEIATYNVLIPEPGQLCATLFIELTTDAQLREWLPKLVGIERSVVLRLHDGTEVRCIPDEEHDAQLTRTEITASVHYIRFELSDAQVDTFSGGPVVLVVDHPAYPHQTELSDENHTELLQDLRP